MKPTIIETFRPLEGYATNNLKQNEPSCFNSMVRVKKYRITIEEIDEPVEVIQKRLKKLIDENDNHHNLSSLRALAKEYGVEL